MSSALERNPQAGAWSWLLAAAVTSAFGCANEEPRPLDKPVAPAMATLNAYAAPTAPLSVTVVGELLQQSAGFVSAIDELGLDRTFISSLQVGIAQLQQQV